MARYSIALMGLLLAVGGCAQQAMVTLPPPNFNGPTVTSPPSTAPPAVAQQSVRPPAVQNVRPSGPAEWAPSAAPRAWRYIVIHHSATTFGCARTFDRMHRDKGWDELGYHFVIGNGSESGNGQIEVGPRWPKQKWGAHTKTADNRFNDYGIGICLVGNFESAYPTAQQMQATSRLVAYLMKTYRITPDRVVGHGDCKPTECPGRHMNVAQVRRTAAALAGMSAAGLDDTRLAHAPDDGHHHDHD